MHHAYIDRLSLMNSPVHRLDPRTKLVCTGLFCMLVVSWPQARLGWIALCLLPLGAAVVISRLPLPYLLKRCVMLSPLAATVAVFFPFTHASGQVLASVGPLNLYADGLLLAGGILARFLLTVLAATVLACSTPFASLLKAMATLRVPRLFIMVLAFLYRYLFVLVDEADRMRRARDSRTPRPGGLGRFMAARGMLGMLFIRAFDRSDRIYSAMLARGFDGSVQTMQQLSFGRADAAAAAAFAVYLCGVVAVLRM